MNGLRPSCARFNRRTRSAAAIVAGLLVAAPVASAHATDVQTEASTTASWSDDAWTTASWSDDDSDRLYSEVILVWGWRFPLVLNPYALDIPLPDVAAAPEPEMRGSRVQFAVNTDDPLAGI